MMLPGSTALSNLVAPSHLILIRLLRRRANFQEAILSVAKSPFSKSEVFQR